jgi:ferredoxin-type protein NapF
LLPLSPWPAVSPASFSPFVALASLVAIRGCGLFALIACPLLILALFRRRGFCRTACPVGLLCEYAGRVHPKARSRCTHWPSMGRWLFAMTLGGACLGYPVFLWLDPLAIFGGFVNAAVWPPVDGNAWFFAAGLPLLIVLSAFRPGAWCLRLCPLGAMQELLWLIRQSGVDRFGVRSSSSLGRPMSSNRPSLPRRLLLATGFGVVGAAIAGRPAGKVASGLHPPGSAAEPALFGLCARCGNCIRACPAKIIRPATDLTNITGLLVPVLHFDDGYCREDCRQCGEVCPSGAIARLPLAEKNRARIGWASVDANVCLLSDNRECSICKSKCPWNAIEYVFSQEDYVMTVAVATDRCNGCGACQSACPTTPKAIRVKTLPVGGLLTGGKVEPVALPH